MSYDVEVFSIENRSRRPHKKAVVGKSQSTVR